MKHRFPFFLPLRGSLSLLFPTEEPNRVYGKTSSEQEIGARLEKQYQRHKAKFVMGRKTSTEFMEHLSEIVDIQLVDLTKVELTHLQEILLEKLKLNVMNHDKDDNYYHFQLYYVLQNEKSRIYYQDPNFVNWAGKKVWLLFETTTGSVQTNSNALQVDLGIYRGISQADIEQKNDYFKWYLSLFKLD